jgi:hypothetical protein
MSNSELPVYATLDCKQFSTHVLQVCMNRPEVGNALNTQMAVDFGVRQQLRQRFSICSWLYRRKRGFSACFRAMGFDIGCHGLVGHA